MTFILGSPRPSVRCKGVHWRGSGEGEAGRGLESGRCSGRGEYSPSNRLVKKSVSLLGSGEGVGARSRVWSLLRRGRTLPLQQVSQKVSQFVREWWRGWGEVRSLVVAQAGEHTFLPNLVGLLVCLLVRCLVSKYVKKTKLVIYQSSSNIYLVFSELN